MAQLIEADILSPLPSKIFLKKGDMLFFRASGGQIKSGDGVIERLGPFVSGLLEADGNNISPMGGPNAVLFLARQPGKASINVVTGGDWSSPANSELEIVVEP